MNRWAACIATALWLAGPRGTPLRAQEPALPAAAAGFQQALVDAIARAELSVVAIARVRKEQPGEGLNFELRRDPFGRSAAPPIPSGPADLDYLPNEYASGVIVDRGGLILTAVHTLAPESEYYVTTPERKVYRATVKGADPRSDLAVLAIEASDLQPIALGEMSAVKKGQVVVALGNPYAIARDGQASAAWGIVSNLSRKAPPLNQEAQSPGQRTLHEFGTLIQTDAKLNLGTSGGALVNLRGEMIGLTVALAAVAGYEQAAGYAIPADATFRRALDALKDGREVEYGFLGIRPVNLKSDEVLQGLHGIRVQNVVQGTPAQRYGLKTDDLITAIGNTPVYDADGLMLEVGRMPPESVAMISVQRGSRQTIVPVTLAKFPVSGKKVVTTPSPAWRGMRVDYATAIPEQERSEVGRRFAFDDGVVVADVEEGTPAWRAGLRSGMFVTHVAGKAVGSPKQFRAAVARKRGAVEVRLAATGEGQPPSSKTIEPE